MIHLKDVTDKLVDAASDVVTVYREYRPQSEKGKDTITNDKSVEDTKSRILDACDEVARLEADTAGAEYKEDEARVMIQGAWSALTEPHPSNHPPHIPVKERNDIWAVRLKTWLAMRKYHGVRLKMLDEARDAEAVARTRQDTLIGMLQSQKPR